LLAIHRLGGDVEVAALIRASTAGLGVGVLDTSHVRVLVIRSSQGELFTRRGIDVVGSAVGGVGTTGTAAVSVGRSSAGDRHRVVASLQVGDGQLHTLLSTGRGQRGRLRVGVQQAERGRKLLVRLVARGRVQVVTDRERSLEL